MTTMTVGQLRAALAQYPDDMPVGFAYPAGDYWGRTLMGEVSKLDTERVQYSDYHRTFQVLTEDRDRDEDRDVTLVLLLR